MKSIYLISENSLKYAKNYPKERIILFKETYLLSFDCDYQTITSAQIAKDIIQASNKKVGCNSKDKANNICQTYEDEFDLYLVYSDKIHELNLEKKTLLIVENNSELNKIDAQKIYLLPPWPIVLEKVKKHYPNHKFDTICDEDEAYFGIKNYYNNLKTCL